MNKILLLFFVGSIFFLSPVTLSQTKKPIGGIDDAVYYKPLVITEGMWLKVMLQLNCDKNLYDGTSMFAVVGEDPDTKKAKIFILYIFPENFYTGSKLEQKSNLLDWKKRAEDCIGGALFECPAIKKKFSYELDVIHQFEYKGPSASMVLMAEIKNGEFQWIEKK